MLIDKDEVINILKDNSIKVNGVFHLGAHECEEMSFYNQLGLSANDVVWVDAIESKVTEMTKKGVPNVFNGIVTDKDDIDVTFNVSNNIQSSSVLEFGTHSTEHPWVVYTHKFTGKSTTVNTFFDKHNLENKYNFWNFDIQGAELMALKGAGKYIPFVDAMYLEVNQRELYKGCALIGEIDSFLDGYGFKRVKTLMTQHGWGDALYIKR